MTGPGFGSQQAAQQAAQQAQRAAQQASRSAADNARMAQQAWMQSEHARRVSQPNTAYRGGGGGLVGGFFRFVGGLLVLAVAAGTGLVVLGQVNPDLFDEVMSWLDGLF